MSVMTEEEMDYQIELEKLYSKKNDNVENLYEFTESELSEHDKQLLEDLNNFLVEEKGEYVGSDIDEFLAIRKEQEK